MILGKEGLSQQQIMTRLEVSKGIAHGSKTLRVTDQWHLKHDQAEQKLNIQRIKTPSSVYPPTKRERKNKDFHIEPKASVIKGPAKSALYFQIMSENLF